MDLLSTASAQSVYRGYEYFEKNKVLKIEKEDETHYHGIVDGSAQNIYEVMIDLEHPKRSKCNCPHAAGRRLVCKHMVALYFAAYPEEARRYIEEFYDTLEAVEQREEEITERIISYVQHMKKAQLQQELLQILLEGPEWQYDKFITEHMLY